MLVAIVAERGYEGVRVGVDPVALGSYFASGAVQVAENSAGLRDRVVRNPAALRFSRMCSNGPMFQRYF